MDKFGIVGLLGKDDAHGRPLYDVREVSHDLKAQLPYTLAGAYRGKQFLVLV